MAGNEGVSELTSERGELLAQLSRWWWVWLLAGLAWIVIALVVLQFDQASVATVGVLIGLMFLLSSVQQFTIAGIAERGGWLWALFGVLFLIAGVLTLISPEETLAGIADMLGFLFLVVGAFWIVQAFVERGAYELWWLGLISGIAMVVLAFWTSGQFFVTRVYLLLVFAGIWALMHGVTDIVRAFELRRMRPAPRRARRRERASGPAPEPAGGTPAAA